jgi:membrane protease YdiL (CAAX protease family)
VLAFAISSLLFSAAHYHPFGSEDWEVWSFAYRAVAGVLFGILFVTRGFAVAAYTHALYDIHVLLLH